MSRHEHPPLEGAIAVHFGPDTLLVDLRDKEDYLAGHIPGAKNLSLAQIKQEAGNQEKDILLYCYYGLKSVRIARMLNAAGYPNARSIGGVHRYVEMLEAE